LKLSNCDCRIDVVSEYTFLSSAEFVLITNSHSSSFFRAADRSESLAEINAACFSKSICSGVFVSNVGDSRSVFNAAAL
jgi:hypothetical protein